MVVRYAGAAPNLATAISTTAFNLGVTATTAVAAGALATVNPTGPVAVGAGTFVLLFVPLLILVLPRRRSTDIAPSAPSTTQSTDTGAHSC